MQRRVTHLSEIGSDLYTLDADAASRDVQIALADTTSVTFFMIASLAKAATFRAHTIEQKQDNTLMKDWRARLVSPGTSINEGGAIPSKAAYAFILSSGGWARTSSGSEEMHEQVLRRP